MATLLLTAAGTLLGGPIGGAIGALAGRSIDGAITGGGRREGPRLKELAITTSSYGQPIARHHGRMRAGGTIIWATELAEHKDKAGGKKGQPSVTTYSYTTSFAVAVSSRPIRAVGRIWADGNLLRGAGGDLKTAGSLRVHSGHGDQAPDPLIAADRGDSCPAFRGCAYAVFEDLALGDFGNRIPALSFEIVADDGGVALAHLLEPLGTDTAAVGDLALLAGFALEGGPIGSTLSTIDTLFPLTCDAGAEGLTLGASIGAAPGETLPTLPEATLGWSEDDFGADDGERRGRQAGEGNRPGALRYYDVARDFQPGVQRPSGRASQGRSRTIEFPGALAADDARGLAEAAARRSDAGRERLQWRMAELDPSLTPGSEVRVPGKPGIWRIEGWEWRSRGVELELSRRSRVGTIPSVGDPGAVPAPADEITGATVLSVFEAPASGLGTEQPALFAAASSPAAGWAGAALYLDRASELVEIGRTGRTRATMGTLAEPLGSSSGVHFEARASLDVAMTDPRSAFVPATLEALALGANRLRVGGEVLQFAAAEQVGPATWRLRGLLRGRGGTEAAAFKGHPAGAEIVLLDSALTPLDPAIVPADPSTTLGAIGLGDAEPVFARLANAGLSRRPPCPVHPRVAGSTTAGLTLGWTRRARGAWLWPDEVETPLVEHEERYRVGLGPVEAPVAEWSVGAPSITLSAETLAPLVQTHPGAKLWVCQIGSYAQSEPLYLATLP